MNELNNNQTKLSPYTSQKDEPLKRLKRNWKYQGRSLSSVDWYEAEVGSNYGGWLCMRFSDRKKPYVEIKHASNILFSRDVVQAIFPGKMHNPFCQWGDFGDYHMTDDGKFDKEKCLLDKSEYVFEKLVHQSGNEYLFLRSMLLGR